jgi:hypothetical protein
MVNAAFPHDDTNARTMETALNLLRSMADRGNTYLGSRHSLLLELWASIGPKSGATAAESTSPPVPEAPATPQSEQPASLVGESLPSPVPPTDWPLPGLPSFNDISFQFDPNDDPALWEGALNQIDIDMDAEWIENTLRR